MPHMRARARRLVLAPIAGAVFAALLAAPVSATGTFLDLRISGPCIDGYGVAQKTYKIEWRDSDANLKSKGTDVSDSGGEFAYCDYEEYLESGDVLKVWKGTSLVRTFTVPKLTIRVDRDADTVSGKSTPNSLVSVLVCGVQACDSDSQT